MTFHIYPGVTYEGGIKGRLLEEFERRYFELIEKYRGKIIIEVGAHDHFADIRYHATKNSTNEYFHNILLSPGVTPMDGSNPGVMTFEVDLNTMVPQNLKMIFLDLDKTLGWESIPNDVSEIPVNVVDFEKEFGLKELSGAALNEFKKKLEGDNEMTKRYLTMKLGFKYEDDG